MRIKQILFGLKNVFGFWFIYSISALLTLSSVPYFVDFLIEKPTYGSEGANIAFSLGDLSILIYMMIPLGIILLWSLPFLFVVHPILKRLQLPKIQSFFVGFISMTIIGVLPFVLPILDYVPFEYAVGVSMYSGLIIGPIIFLCSTSILLYTKFAKQ